MERENLSFRCQERNSSYTHSKSERIDAEHRGGTSRSSVDRLRKLAGAKGKYYLVFYMEEN